MSCLEKAKLVDSLPTSGGGGVQPSRVGQENSTAVVLSAKFKSYENWLRYSRLHQHAEGSGHDALRSRVTLVIVSLRVLT